ncbi:MAG: hypothetical protein GTN38_02685 [Candidatus Aenigmarchaeota archaeon]|nr:hypothetical protein [Candidatus Aenigmarchaeota archaeon]NIP40543.1 hypothetical protein [Candidatus Aenigmarchaeota archaeon]NIQ18388.1 hypothetical protein [Candidatus Aenigmarchaeota archaeon]
MKEKRKYRSKLIEIKTKKQAVREMERIGASGIWIMAPKSVFKVVKLHSVRNAIANIIKQEMLSIGGEAAVNRGTVNCSVPETDVLLMGTLRHYDLLIKKLKIQVGESKEIAEELEKALKGFL